MKPVTAFILMAVSGMFFTSPRRQIPLTQNIRLNFHHTIGGKELVLGNTYKNILGENITIQKFKYYISNFSVTDEKGKLTKLPARYFLVDEADSASKTIRLNIPVKTISTIRFLLGVDSIKNVSGVQSGALDPLKGMFWTWNSGYIMAKLEGSSEVSTIAGHYFLYHVGGFRNAMNTARVIELAISQKDKPLKEISIRAEIDQWFKSRSELRTADTPVCHDPGPLAVRIADNYSTMFSINSLR